MKDRRSFRCVNDGIVYLSLDLGDDRWDSKQSGLGGDARLTSRTVATPRGGICRGGAQLRGQTESLRAARMWTSNPPLNDKNVGRPRSRAKERRGRTPRLKGSAGRWRIPWPFSARPLVHPPALPPWKCVTSSPIRRGRRCGWQAGHRDSPNESAVRRCLREPVSAELPNRPGMVERSRSWHGLPRPVSGSKSRTPAAGNQPLPLLWQNRATGRLPSILSRWNHHQLRSMRYRALTGELCSSLARQPVAAQPSEVG